MSYYFLRIFSIISMLIASAYAINVENVSKELKSR